MKNKKTIIILAILIVLITGIFLVNNIYQNKNKVNKTKRKKLNNLAIMIKEDGADNYSSYSSIPIGDYVLNEEKTICENGGKVVSYDNSTGQIGFSFLGSDRCSLYFVGTKAYGDGVTYSNGSYTLTNATTIEVSSSNISTLVGKYTCNSSSTTGTCTNAKYIVSASGYYIYYYSLSGGDLDGTDNGKNYVFGSSFTYENGTYTLSSTTTINSDTFRTNKSNVNTHHYTCFSSGTTCTSIYYVYYIAEGTAMCITLTGGKSVDDALNEMLYNDDVNTKNSPIKTYIDNWYSNNMTSYADKLEDTVFCNDRSMSNKETNEWYPNGGRTSTHLYFKNNNTNNTSLKCTNENDKFTVESSNGNGALTYPVGLLTAPEAKLANYGSSNYLYNGEIFWLGSPQSFSTNTAFIRVLRTSEISTDSPTASRGVRPVISLKPNTEISSGDGSFTAPFVIE